MVECGPLAIPGRLLGRIAGPGIRALVPDRPVELVGQDLEIGLYPSDISIGGKRAVVARARAAIATRLTSTAASMTTSAEAQEVEAMLEALTKGRVGGAEPGAGTTVDQTAASATLSAIDGRLAELDVPHDEWEILYRQRLQVERDLLAGRAPGSVLTSEPSTPLGIGIAAARDRARSDRRGPGWSDLIAVGGLALIATDVALAVAERFRRTSGRHRR